jgi:glucose-1-phosphate adenylyltransferase
MKNEVALILAGGRGKRMDILCSLRPKPVLPFAGKFHVIDFTYSNCVHSEISDVAVLVDYQRGHMADYLSDWHSLYGNTTSLSILPPKVDTYAGTADAVYQNLDYLEKQESDAVIILAGDHIYKMDYRKMMAFHRLMRAEVSVGVVRVPLEEIHRFGMVTVNAAGRIEEFKEKSSASRSNLASMGIYIFNKDLLAKRLQEDAAESGSLHDFGYNILPRMVKADRVFAYEFKGYWHDIGTVASYYEANMELLVPRPRFTLDSDWPILHESNMLSVCRKGKEGSILNSLISPGCDIRGQVENSVLSPGVHVAEQAVVKNSVIMADASIGFHSIVNGCIVDEGVNIGKFCYVGFGTGVLPGKPEITVLGKEVTVPDRTAIGHNCSIPPGLGAEAFGARLIPSGTILVNSRT